MGGDVIMGTSVAVYFSSSSKSGNTARLLTAFMKGVERGGDKTKVFDVKEIQPSPCTGELDCWFKDPGNCYIQDGMQDLYPVLREADTLILGTPVYIPLPGEMQNLLNRLTPIVDPELETRDGRTRGRVREGVAIRRIVLVASSGWWEIENMDTVQGKPTEILQAVEQAGFEFASTGEIQAETLSTVSQPLIRQEEYRQYLNKMRTGASE
jgi:hypothetical protein